MAFVFTDTNFQKEVIDSDTLVVVDFWASWCGPCQMIGPVIEELATEYEGKVKIGKMSVEENEKIPQELGIQSIPAIKFFKGGKEVDQILGGQPKEVFKEMIDKYMG
jgi:thioredoxin 1